VVGRARGRVVHKSEVPILFYFLRARGAVGPRWLARKICCTPRAQLIGPAGLRRIAQPAGLRISRTFGAARLQRERESERKEHRRLLQSRQAMHAP
jgi:hypothetical protein